MPGLPSSLHYGNLVNRASPLNRGLVAWWLNLPQGGKGNTWFDIAGRAHGTLTNGAAFSGTVGRSCGHGSMFFDGSNDRVALGSVTSLEITGDISVFCWIKTTLASTYKELINAAVGSSPFNGWGFGMGNINGKIGWWQNGNVDWASSTSSYNTGNWEHIGVTCLGTAGTFYLNGRLDSTFTNTNATRGASGAEKDIGGNSLNARFHSGNVDDLRVFSRALTSGEALNLYQDSRQGYAQTLNRVRPYLLVNVGAAPTSKPFYFRHYIAGRAV